MAARAAKAANVNSEYGDVELWPRGAALAGLWALFVACRRNGGVRTSHRFFGVDAGLAGELGRVAQAEGFVFEAAAEIGCTVIVVAVK